MLNGDLKSEAIKELKKSIKNNKELVKVVQAKAADLFTLRLQSSEEIIGGIENYINTLSNSPIEFDRTFAEYKAEYKVFSDLLHEIKIKGSEIDTEFGITATAGVLTGIGTAAFAPTAAMAIATTFGAASTGTAIASLSGVAATNAALAWLGGGALVAGGSGMAGGSALLALAGPIGWIIGGAAIIGGGLYASSQNEEIAREANEKRKEVEVDIARLSSSSIELNRLLTLTQKHVNGLKSILTYLISSAPDDYKLFSKDQRNYLLALIDEVRSLSVLLNKKIS